MSTVALPSRSRLRLGRKSVPGVKKQRKPIAVILATVWIVALMVMIFLTAVIDVLPIKDPNISDFRAVAARPGAPDHILGTDEIGRDILARLVVGARVSLTVGIGSILMSMTIGLTVGIAAGYFRGAIDRVLSGILEVLLAFPSLITLISIGVFLGPSLRNVTLGLGIVGTPYFSRVARANALAFSNREFVIAARGMGASTWRIISREVFPNVIPPVLSFGLILISVAIIAEGGLSFLGLGVPPPSSSWGSMMGNGRGKLATDPHIVFIPAAAMFFTVLSLNFLGDHLGKRFDIRESVL